MTYIRRVAQEVGVSIGTASRTITCLADHNVTVHLLLYLWLLFLVLASFSACSGATQSSSPTIIPTGSVPAKDSISGSGEWVMEGYSPQRDRATVDDIQPPLSVHQEFTVGGNTQFGSPVGVARGLLFVEGRRMLHAVALDSGEEQWHFDLPGSFVSPAVAGNSVFVRAESGEEGYIVALNADVGLKLWQYKFAHVGSVYNNVGGHVTSPVVAEGLVLVGAAQAYHALNAETGKEVWSFNTKAPVASSAAVAGDIAYFTDFTRLYAVDLKTGAKRWHFEFETMSLFFAPVVISDEIITTSSNIVYALNRHSGEVLWSRTINAESLVPSAAARDRIYIKSVNQLFALDRLTGEIAWSYEVADFVSLPTVAGEQIYVITRAGGRGQLRALRLTDGQEIWQIENIRLANAAPVVAGGHVYVRTVDGRVLVYD